MTQVVNLNRDEVKLLLSGLHNLVLDPNLLEYITSIDVKAKNNIGNLINKFEDTFKG